MDTMCYSKGRVLIVIGPYAGNLPVIIKASSQIYGITLIGVMLGYLNDSHATGKGDQGEGIVFFVKAVIGSMLFDKINGTCADFLVVIIGIIVAAIVNASVFIEALVFIRAGPAVSVTVPAAAIFAPDAFVVIPC